MAPNQHQPVVGLIVPFFLDSDRSLIHGVGVGTPRLVVSKGIHIALNLPHLSPRYCCAECVTAVNDFVKDQLNVRQTTPAYSVRAHPQMDHRQATGLTIRPKINLCANHEFRGHGGEIEEGDTMITYPVQYVSANVVRRGYRTPSVLDILIRCPPILWKEIPHFGHRKEVEFSRWSPKGSHATHRATLVDIIARTDQELRKETAELTSLGGSLGDASSLAQTQKEAFNIPQTHSLPYSNVPKVSIISPPRRSNHAP
ncbi:hypothetical protein BDR04DRAFT_1122816 [Suillus decipiens]|nr:hypothetical protein BDR04DRAFT_1122816 [Suillus decipiens]